MASQKSEEERFYINTMDLAELSYTLIVQVQSLGVNVIDPKIVRFGIGFLKSLSPDKLITAFISGSHSHWDQIKKRNEDFFIKNSANIFAGLPSQCASTFSEIFISKTSSGENAISQDDRNIMWKYFESFVKIAIKYIHKVRGPYLHNGEPAYSKDMFPEVELEKHSSDWDVKLTFTN